MSKENVLERDGEVIEVLPAGTFRIKLKEVDSIIRCKKSGKMQQSNISVIIWDKVRVEVSQYDMNQWRIVYRYNEWASAPHNPNNPQRPVKH